MQIERGAIGICCAKLGEAEVFAAAGIDDIRLPYPINPVNADRVLRAARRARSSRSSSINLDVARAWSDAMRAPAQNVRRAREGRRRLPSLRHRSATQPGAAEFMARVAELPGLQLPRAAEPRRSRATARRPTQRSQRLPRRRPGSLTTLADRRRHAGRARRGDQRRRDADGAVQRCSRRASRRSAPGNYVYFDRTQVGLGAATWNDCALTVLATVVSRPAADRIILDCGSKTLSNDLARGFSRNAGPRRRLPRTLDEPGAERSADDRAALGGARDGARARSGGHRLEPAIWCACCRTTPAWCRIWSTAVWLVNGSTVRRRRCRSAARGRIA